MLCIKCQQTISEGTNRLCKDCGQKMLAEIQNQKNIISAVKKGVMPSGEEEVQINQQTENPNKETSPSAYNTEELISAQTPSQTVPDYQETKKGKQGNWLIIIGLIITLLIGALMGAFFYYPLLKG